MVNKEIAKIFYGIADFLKIKEVKFKPAAYNKAALIIENLGEDIRDIYKRGGKKALEEIPGVGESMANKIEEFLKTGKVKYYEDLKKKLPVKMEELTSIEGLGPKRVKVLYQKLGIRNLKDLEKAAKAGKIAPLFGFDRKTEKNILQGLEFLKKSKGRFLLGEILPLAQKMKDRLSGIEEVKRVDIAGSLRRRKETIGDMDFLVIAQKTKAKKTIRAAANKIMDAFVSFPEVVKVWGKGETKSSIHLKLGIDVDLRVIKEESYGSALQYFTGSKEHNIVTRKIAMGKGLKLNEYGLFRKRKRIAGRDEKEIYEILGMDWIPPELRTNRGEIEAALEHKLPKIIGYSDIKGDLHCHSKWDGGSDSIEEMAKVAMKMGYEYLGITDHTKALKIEHGLSERQLAAQRNEIERLNFQFSIFNFQILQGAETNILKDGSIDISDSALRKLDYAIAGVHSSLKMAKAEMTERIIRAMKNPYINIIAHPTGRILKKRDRYQIDFDKILRAAKITNTILEINSQPERLDLSDSNIRRAKEEGVLMVIDTDSHHKEHLRYMELGISQARRGWAEKEDIVNCWPLEKVLAIFNKKSKRNTKNP